MKSIVILSDRPEVDNGLVHLLEKLFPESHIRILSRQTESFVDALGAPEAATRDKGKDKNVKHFDRR